MRGNEDGEKSSVTATITGAFPIPMRGNELGEAVRAGAREGVPDPHEG